MTHVVVRTVLTLTLGGLAIACGDRSAAPLTAPSVTSAPSVVPVSGPILSGHVYEVTSEAQRAVSFGNVWYSVDGGMVKSVTLDTSGQYTISALSTGSRIRLTANSPNLQQTCAVYTVFDGADTVLDIKLVRSGTNDSTCDGPTLSGVVFRIVEGERRPLKDQRVGFYSADQAGGWDVYATTSPDGRFAFTGLPRGSGTLLAGDCSDAMDSQPIDIRGNANVVDFDLTAFIQRCPGVSPPE